MADLRLAAGNQAGAAAAARAYWLTSVEQPSRLPRAIDTVTTVMQAQGVNAETIQAFRLQQLRGSDLDAPQAEILRPSTNSFGKAKLFAKTWIQNAASPLDRARMYLLNGTLHSAAPILQKVLASSDASPDQRDRALLLVRMAFALYDGHMHRISRYERYLLQAADGNAGENPLKMLTQSTAGQQAHVPMHP